MPAGPIQPGAQSVLFDRCLSMRLGGDSIRHKTVDRIIKYFAFVVTLGRPRPAILILQIGCFSFVPRMLLIFAGRIYFARRIHGRVGEATA